MVEVLISQTPSVQDMRDGFVTQPSLGQTAGVQLFLRNFTFLNVVDVFIILRSLPPSQGLSGPIPKLLK
jgi:hypothetical protein